MSLPLPPLPPPRLPPLPPVVKPLLDHIAVTHVGTGQLEVRIGSVVAIITRTEAFRLLGMLERAAPNVAFTQSKDGWK
jgi:hypothetical protein